MAITKLFGNKIAPACKYCENAKGKVMGDGMILCGRKGVVSSEYNCRAYIYDPLKRIPAKRVKQKFSQEDFTL